MKRLTGHGVYSGSAIYQRLFAIENILGEDYDLDELKTLIEEKNARSQMPKVGMTVFYLDSDTGELEQGTVFSVHYKNSILDTIAIDFDSGDFDEFIGEAWNDCIFNSKESALNALREGND